MKERNQSFTPTPDFSRRLAKSTLEPAKPSYLERKELLLTSSRVPKQRIPESLTARAYHATTTRLPPPIPFQQRMIDSQPIPLNRKVALDPDLRRVMKRLAAVDKRIQVYDEQPPAALDESVFDISKYVWQRKKQSYDDNPLLLGNFMGVGDDSYITNWKQKSHLNDDLPSVE
jgi:hypothetical protein